MRYIAVLPYMYIPYKEECLSTCKLENILLVDNTKENLGMPVSLNLGIDKMFKDNADWLILLSATIRFGTLGGLDFVKALENSSGIHFVSTTLGNGHLVAWSRQVIEKVGRFDENFYPAYCDDTDYHTRIARTYAVGERHYLKVEVDVTSMGDHHAISLAELQVDFVVLRAYYKQKWGGLEGQEIYTFPFNDPNRSIKYWPIPSNTKGRWND